MLQLLSLRSLLVCNLVREGRLPHKQYSPLASLASAADMGMSSPSVFPTAPSSSDASSLSSSSSLTPRPPSPGSSPETPSCVKTVLEASWLSMLRRHKNEGKMSLNTYFELRYLNCIGSIRRYFIIIITFEWKVQKIFSNIYFSNFNCR